MTGPATDIVVMQDIDKSFPGVHALDHVTSPSPAARSTHWSARTGPASRP